MLEELQVPLADVVFLLSDAPYYNTLGAVMQNHSATLGCPRVQKVTAPVY